MYFCNSEQRQICHGLNSSGNIRLEYELWNGQHNLTSTDGACDVSYLNCGMRRWGEGVSAWAVTSSGRFIAWLCGILGLSTPIDFRDQKRMRFLCSVYEIIFWSRPVSNLMKICLEVLKRICRQTRYFLHRVVC